MSRPLPETTGQTIRRLRRQNASAEQISAAQRAHGRHLQAQLGAIVGDPDAPACDCATCEPVAESAATPPEATP